MITILLLVRLTCPQAEQTPDTSCSHIMLPSLIPITLPLSSPFPHLTNSKLYLRLRPHPDKCPARVAAQYVPPFSTTAKNRLYSSVLLRPPPKVASDLTTVRHLQKVAPFPTKKIKPVAAIATGLTWYGQGGGMWWRVYKPPDAPCSASWC